MGCHRDRAGGLGPEEARPSGWKKGPFLRAGTKRVREDGSGVQSGSSVANCACRGSLMTSEQGRAEPTLQQKEKPSPGEETAPSSPKRPYDTAEQHLHKYFERTWRVQAPRSHRIGRPIQLGFQTGDWQIVETTGRQ